jgi:hypothetical protein
VGFSRTSTQTLLGYVLLKEMKPILLMRTLYIVDIYTTHTQPLASPFISWLPKPSQLGACRPARAHAQDVACQHLERIVRPHYYKKWPGCKVIHKQSCQELSVKWTYQELNWHNHMIYCINKYNVTYLANPMKSS